MALESTTKIGPSRQRETAEDPELRRIDARLVEIEEERDAIARELQELDAMIRGYAQKKVSEVETQEAKSSNEERSDMAPSVEQADTEYRQEIKKAEIVVDRAAQALEEEKDKKILEILRESAAQRKDADDNKILRLLGKIHRAFTKNLKRKLLYYTVLPLGATTAVALQTETGQEYFEMAKNWSERHVVKKFASDPSIEGVDESYARTHVASRTAETPDKKSEVRSVLAKSIERTTYDFLGKAKIDYKSGYYMVSVFDLSDPTPPRFKIINDRERYNKIDSAAGITTNLLRKFYKYGEFEPVLKGHARYVEVDGDMIPYNGNLTPKEDVPVIAYNTKTETIRAGLFKEFDDDWMVSETWEIPLNFRPNPDGTINLTYPKATLRMCPVTINEEGREIPFSIGITKDKSVKTFNPYEAKSFGTLEGGKVIMVCDKKQVQVNGSFADMYRVYERLKKEYNGAPVKAYLLDNGSYNLPIWNKDDVLTTKEIKEHLQRHKGGGTALVLINDGSISPYDNYRSRYREFEHQIQGYTLNKETGEPALNSKEVVVLHHTGNYADPMQIVREFKDPSKERSAHVLILKDGTRHVFNNDDYVLAHAGKSEFGGKNAVNFFSIGVEMEGDSRSGQFTIAQIESLVEYLRPRVEKYGIPLENITTHKIIRENYIKSHPEDKQVLTKVDLDDKIWEELKKTLAKKLYDKKNAKLTGVKANQMIGALTYQGAYRLTGNKEYALGKARQILAENGVSPRNINRTVNWLTKNNAA